MTKREPPNTIGFVKEFLEFVIRQLVEFPDEMMLSEIPSGKMTIFRVQLRQSDVGRIIGRNGQTIHAIRALLASSAARHASASNCGRATSAALLGATARRFTPFAHCWPALLRVTASAPRSRSLSEVGSIDPNRPPLLFGIAIRAVR